MVRMQKAQSNCLACNIEVACDNVTDMIGVVDAVIIARDDLTF